MPDDSDVIRAYFDRYGSKIYNPEANEAALEEKRKLDERKAELALLYPPRRPPRH